MKILGNVDKYPFRIHFVGLLLTFLLNGCGLVSVMDVAVLALSAPVPGSKKTANLPEGFSLKPSLPEDSTDLLLAAIPPEQGNVYFTGRVEWTGLSNLKQSVLAVNQSMSAITDFNILFLWWSEVHERYEVLIRLPFEDIYSVELWTPGFGTNIRFCHEEDEIQFADQSLPIDQKTVLRILKPNGWFIDAERTREVFTLLEGRIAKNTESQDLPSPCDQVVLLDEKAPKGFGNCDPAIEEC